MKKNKICLLAAVLLIVIPVAISFTGKLKLFVIAGIICSVLALIASIVGVRFAKKEESSKAGLIILIIVSILFTFIYLGGFVIGKFIKDPSLTKDLCPQLKNCRYIGDERSACYMDTDTTKLLEIYCDNSILNQDQYE